MKWYAWLLLAGVVVLGLIWAGATLRDGWRDFEELRQAIDLVDRGAFEDAWPLLQKHQARAGRADERYNLARGICARGLGRYDEAITALRKIDTNSPIGRRARAERVALARHSGRFSEAFGIRASDLPQDGEAARAAREDLIFLLRIQGRDEEVRAILRKQLASSADPIADLRSLWSLDHEAYPIHAARDALEAAGARAPGDVGVRLGFVNLALREHDLAEARRQLDRCAVDDRNAHEIGLARLHLARAAQDQVAVAEAVALLQAERIAGVSWLELRAWIAELCGDMVREAAALRVLLEHEPAHASALERLAQLAAGSGHPEEAAVLRRRKSERDRAEREFERLLNSDEAPTRGAELGALAETMGLAGEARACWKLAAKAQNGDSAVRDALRRVERLGSSRPPDPVELRQQVVQVIQECASPAAGAALDPAQHVPSYQDVAQAAGLDFVFDNGDTPEHQMPETMAGGVGVIDFDGDGWLDVYLAQGGRFPPRQQEKNGDRLFRNRGGGAFEDATISAGLGAFRGGYTHGVAVGDVNNDGYPDLLITRWRHYALYLNRGARFADETDAWGLGGERGWPTSAALADLDGDGDLDLYVCHYVRWDAEKPTLCKGPGGKPTFCSPVGFPSEVDRLFRNDGDRFTDISDASGIAAGDRDGRGLGVIAADLDGDHRVDLFVANDTTANFFFRNKGNLVFEECALTSGLAANAAGGFLAGMGVACGDVDGDARIDLGVTNFYGECTTFYRNLGAGQFADSSDAIGLAGPTRYRLGFGLAFADMNNDGYLDILQANGHVEDYERAAPYAMPAQLFLGDGRGRVREVSQRAGPPWGVPRFGRGLATADLDNDGRLEVLLVDLRGAFSCLRVEKTEAVPGRYLLLELAGTRSNRDGVGAEVSVNAGGRRWIQQRFGGGSYLSASDPRLHFGLEGHARADKVTIRWPSGEVSDFRDVETNARYRLTEGSSVIERLSP